jgi:hypothetical protein
MIEGLKLAHSLANAVDTDMQLIREIQQEEEMASRDRELSLRMQGIIIPRVQPARSQPNEDFQRNFVGIEQHSRASSVVAGPSGMRVGPQEPRSAERSRSSVSGQIEAEEEEESSRNEPHKCNVCLDKFEPAQLIHTPCGHVWCAGCIPNLFKRAIETELYFPPSCCSQSVPLELVQRYLSQDIVDDFNAATVEYATAKRVYCRSCSSFIPLSEYNKAEATAKCLKCHAETCTLCFGNAHQVMEACVEDKELATVLGLANDKGWRRCPRCDHMIELIEGCMHIR